VGIIQPSSLLKLPDIVNALLREFNGLINTDNLDPGGLDGSKVLKAGSVTDEKIAALPGALIRETPTNVAIGHATYSTIFFNTAVFDNDGMADLANDRLVVKTPGVYVTVLTAEWASNATGYREIEVILNGAQLAAVNSPAISGDGVKQSCVTAPIRLAAGDLLTAKGYQNSGGSLDIRAISGSPYLGAHWLGP
jgi:hypothetical protein